MQQMNKEYSSSRLNDADRELCLAPILLLIRLSRESSQTCNQCSAVCAHPCIYISIVGRHLFDRFIETLDA